MKASEQRQLQIAECRKKYAERKKEVQKVESKHVTQEHRWKDAERQRKLREAQRKSQTEKQLQVYQQIEAERIRAYQNRENKEQADAHRKKMQKGIRNYVPVRKQIKYS